MTNCMHTIKSCISILLQSSWQENFGLSNDGFIYYSVMSCFVKYLKYIDVLLVIQHSLASVITIKVGLSWSILSLSGYFLGVIRYGPMGPCIPTNSPSLVRSLRHFRLARISVRGDRNLRHLSICFFLFFFFVFRPSFRIFQL